MINRTRKGNARQRQARRKLEADGWQVITAKRSSQWDTEIDFFGLFDLCAYRDGYFLWVQVKSNQCPNEVRERIRAFMTDGVFVRRELWIYKDYSREGPVIERL